MPQVGLAVYEHAWTYYCTCQTGKVPYVQPPATPVFTLFESVSSAQELYRKAREEANRRSIGKVVNLPD